MRTALAVLAVLGLVTGCRGPDGPDVLAASPGPTTAAITIGTTAPSSTPSAATTTTSATVTPVPTTTSTTTTTTSTTTSTTTTSTSTTTTLPPPPTTACERVIHIGDSTGVYLWEAQYVGDPAYTMEQRYRDVGVVDIVADNSGGRAVEGRVADWQTTAFEVAFAARRAGFEGCWVVMIGTNDAAAISAGAAMGAAERILRMLYVIGDEPVLWVDAVTDGWVTSGYRNESMRAWNDVLVEIAAQRPNVVVLRWSERVRTEWFSADGVHYTTDGHAWRAAITALALAEAFPA